MKKHNEDKEKSSLNRNRLKMRYSNFVELFREEDGEWIATIKAGIIRFKDDIDIDLSDIKFAANVSYGMLSRKLEIKRQCEANRSSFEANTDDICALNMDSCKDIVLPGSKPNTFVFNARGHYLRSEDVDTIDMPICNPEPEIRITRVTEYNDDQDDFWDNARARYIQESRRIYKLNQFEGK